jgi:GDP-4-dehydro-6-deoxy-D-mannose reductase
MTSLVTGADGFVGAWLVEHLRSLGDDVVAATLRDFDIRDRSSVDRLVISAKPDRIFHLAAQSLPGVSWEMPAETFRVNIEGALNLLEAVRAAQLETVVVVAGSSSEYASSAEPIAETGPLEPLSPYAVSKMAVGHIVRLYAQRYGMQVVLVRPFFLVGPGKVGDVSSDFARRIVAVERGEATEVPVGRLDVVRDFLDVRDGAGAMAVAAERGVAGEAYNVCSGTGITLGDLLALFGRHARVPVRARQDPALLRPLDEPVKVGHPGKLRALGWSPSRSIAETAAEILEYWRCK